MGGFHHSGSAFCDARFLRTRGSQRKPGKASAFEQSLNINSWGQLPQIVVDSRDGFTIGNPARFSRGRYPDEKVYSAQEQVKWVHGKVLLHAGLELSHENDATSRLRNQTGTYYYSSIGDFASDALAFFAFGMSGQLNPMEQHNCDQRGKPWRDAAGGLHGLGYLPCYSYYSQTMGPSEWWLSTNDWASYVTSQWHPNKRTVFTAAMRWEVEQLPPAISKVDNPDLPLTERLPSLGSQWGPQQDLPGEQERAGACAASGLCDVFRAHAECPGGNGVDADRIARRRSQLLHASHG